MDTDLSERKSKVLNLIIKNFLDTGEPVGSRTVSKLFEGSLSSATIRNEMADLEDLGYIVQPHTSAGRVPTDRGYRYYVDRLIVENDEKVSKMQEYVIEKTEKMDKVFQKMTKFLASNTNYASMVMHPAVVGTKVKFIQLSVLDHNQIVAVIVMNGNIVRNRIVTVSEEMDNESMLKLNMLLNTTLNGLTADQINLGLMTAMKQQAGIHENIVSEVLDAIASTLKDTNKMQIYTSGATNLIQYPELFESENVMGLLTAFEEKDELVQMIEENFPEEIGTDIQVYIGDESSLSNMKDCSLVTASYDLGSGMQGRIGIIGPKRMDYEKVLKSLKTMKEQLDVAFHKKE